ncbi:hypothetical protein TWF281_001787 [Arthrobotrys megalospora]
MHMSLPEKFPLPVTARRSPIRRLRNIVTAIAGTLFILVFLLAVRIYRTGTSDVIVADLPAFPTTPVIPKPPPPSPSQKNPETTNEDEPLTPPAIFNPPKPNTERPMLRDDGVILTGVKNSTIWHSVGRHPARKECWSYISRFEPYVSPPQEVLDLISNNNKPTNNRALILRLSTGQPWKKEFTHHARALVLEAGHLANYDVHFLLHGNKPPAELRKWVQRHVPKEFRKITQVFSTEDIKSWLNGTAAFKNIMEHNHLVIQKFMTEHKQYDFVYSVESDLRQIGRWDNLLSDIDEEYKSHRERQEPDQDMPEIPDLVTFEGLRRPVHDWLWITYECVEGFGGHKNLRTSLGPMWGWSRRLIEKMNEYNAKGVNCFYELFSPTVAYNNNLTTFFYQHPLYCPRKSASGRSSLTLEDLGKNDPRTMQYEKPARGCTYFFVNPHSQPFWEEWYRAAKNPDACWPPALIHPIKGDFFN